MRKLGMLGIGFVLLLTGCTRGDTEVNRQSKSDLEAVSGMKLPADALFLYQGGSGRKGEAFREYVMQSNSGFEIHKGSEAKIPSESVAETIAKLVPAGKYGKVNQSEASVSDWVNDHGEWRASVVATDKGWLLHLEDLKEK